MRLAILKLSEGKADRLREFVQAALVDYRDVLAWAEYPEQLASGASRYNTPAEEYEAILARDRQGFLDWIASFDSKGGDG